jgi:hypothetical protein
LVGLAVTQNRVAHKGKLTTVESEQGEEKVKTKLSIHLKGWGVLVGSILILFTVMPIYGYAADLVGYWPFEDSSGSKVLDASGNGNDGTIYGGATRVQGKCGKGLSFNGTSSYVLVPGTGSINVGTWTVTCWVSFSRLDVVQVILDKRTDYLYRNYCLEYSPDETVPSGTHESYLFAIIGNATSVGPHTNDYGTFAPVELAKNTFYHMAATYDGSYVNLYIDGSLKASKKMDMTGITGTGDLSIGATLDPTLDAVTYGIIDEVKIFNAPLTRDEILAEMQRCASAVSGCMKVKGMPLDDTKVVLWQWLKKPQVTTTDDDGYFEFDRIAPSGKFWLTIGAPE